MFLGTLNDDNYSGPLISSSMVAGRKSKFEGNEYASYVVPNNATANVLSSIQIRFELVPKRWILQHVNVLGLIIGFVGVQQGCAHQKTTREEDYGQIWIGPIVPF